MCEADVVVWPSLIYNVQQGDFDMKYMCIVFASLSLFIAGCTPPSVRLAQAGSHRSQNVSDGVHTDMFAALSRENFETAKLQILLETEKAKRGLPDEVSAKLDEVANNSIAGLTEFAKKRDVMVGWDRDHERANALKYVTVDQKLFSQQGIFNYLGQRIAGGSRKLVTAWDEAKQEWEHSIGNDTTTQPSN